MLPERRPGPALDYLERWCRTPFQELPARPTPRGRGFVRPVRVRGFAATSRRHVFDRRTSLTVWFTACWLFATQKGGSRPERSGRGIGSYQTAGRCCHRLRSALLRPGPGAAAGTVEVDETYIGGGGARAARRPGAGKGHRAGIATEVTTAEGRRMRIIGVSRIPPAQPLLLDPVAQARLRVLRIHLGVGWPAAPTNGIERIDQLRAGQRPDIWGQEHPVQETESAARCRRRAAATQRLSRRQLASSSCCATAFIASPA